MASYLRWLKSNVSNTPLAHVASLLVLAAAIVLEAINTIYLGEGVTFIAFIPIIIVIVYLEGRLVAIAATFLMAAAGLWMRRVLNAHLSAEDWTSAIFLLVSGGLIAFVFHRLRQDLRGALEVAE